MRARKRSVGNCARGNEPRVSAVRPSQARRSAFFLIQEARAAAAALSLLFFFFQSQGEAFSAGARAEGFFVVGQVRYRRDVGIGLFVFLPGGGLIARRSVRDAWVMWGAGLHTCECWNIKAEVAAGCRVWLVCETGVFA